MQFTKLRLTGFKSFVDPAEMLITPGLTGIVGPNGCGKSNLLEALRWVMGDATAKSLRAGGMDDVIFAGTQRRPSRNIAEVVLAIDNEDRRAPAAFNDLAQIEVTRRIERENGSDYRINGKSVRARDVQLLFADCATGSDSPAMVSQGRVGALVTAKPKDRRAILEDAAGTSGLHQRRHEAELRLKAAEANLLRLQDLVTALEAQLGVVRRQARQADRYRKMSARIRDVQAYVLALRWRQASLAREAAESDCARAGETVETRTRAAAEAAAIRADAAAHLPALREAERQAAAELAHLTGELRALDEEEKRTTSRLMDLVRQLEHGQADLQREAAILADASTALDKAEAERAQLEAEDAAETGQRAIAAEQTATARDTLKSAEAAHDNVAQKLAHAVAERNALNNRLADLERRLANIRQQKAQLTARKDQLTPTPAREQAAETAAALEAARAALASARAEAETAEKARALAQDAERQAQGRLLKSRADEAAIAAEIKALRAVAAGDVGAARRPLLDALNVEPGFEAALAAALGDDLKASLDSDAPLHWRDLPPIADMVPLPEGVPSLASHVAAPPLLARRLAAIGLVDAAQGAALQSGLRPGQRLVSREGALWRWDGYAVSAGAPQPAAIRLAQRNRLRALEAELAGLAAISQQAEGEHRAAAEAQAHLNQAERAARDAARRAEQTEQAAHQAMLKAERDAARLDGELQNLDLQIARADQDETAASAQREDTAIALGALPDHEELRGAQHRLRADMDIARAELAAFQAAEDGLRQQAGLRQKRLQALATEREAWRLRRDSAHQQMAQLEQRRDALKADSIELQDQARTIAPRRTALADGLRAAEAARAEAADRLAGAESRMAEADRAAQASETALTEAREAAIRLEAARERALERCQALTHESLEQFETEPAGLTRILDPELTMGLDAAETELNQLKTDRERMGPVNLLAEQEEAELDEKYHLTISERADLEQAIGRLRQAIGQLNREGRERLQTAFGQVDAHFRELYQTLFQGGEARLELTESDDPLEAGLDILASPPGKRLQSLSLLSGGEQALTAMALIFAVFLTNPSPICVLDEVDAPLDDANVERFCNLLDEMTRRTGTRFLIVTHNAFTMSRMHRLYGVTMAERGVSSLVSVALDRAPLLLAAE